MSIRFFSVTWAAAFASTALIAVAPTAAATFDDGVQIEAGIATLTVPVDFAAITAGFFAPPAVTLGPGFDFAGGSDGFDLSGGTIRGGCTNTTALGCSGSFVDPPGAGITALVIFDQFDALDPIIGVSAVFANAAFFDENRIVLDLSGLDFPVNPATEILATVTFGQNGETGGPAAVPLPASLIMLLAGLGVFGGLTGLRRPPAGAPG